MLVCGNIIEVNVIMLDMFIVYSIKVVFCNNIGVGNYSDIVECIMDEGGKGFFFVFSYYCVGI